MKKEAVKKGAVKIESKTFAQKVKRNPKIIEKIVSKYNKQCNVKQ